MDTANYPNYLILRDSQGTVWYVGLLGFPEQLTMDSNLSPAYPGTPFAGAKVKDAQGTTWYLIAQPTKQLAVSSTPPTGTVLDIGAGLSLLGSDNYWGVVSANAQGQTLVTSAPVQTPQGPLQPTFTLGRRLGIPTYQRGQTLPVMLWAHNLLDGALLTLPAAPQMTLTDPTGATVGQGLFQYLSQGTYTYIFQSQGNSATGAYRMTAQLLLGMQTDVTLSQVGFVLT